MPDACHSGEPLRSIFDHDGALWLPAFRTGRGYFAYRVPKTGDPQEIADVGAPSSSTRPETSGRSRSSPGPATSSSSGATARSSRRLQVPNTDGDAAFLVSDRPGSVYLWTGLGLQHLVADGPRFTQYRLENRYTVEGLQGIHATKDLLSPSPHYAYVGQGYLAVLNRLEVRNSAYHLYLIKLPAGDAEQPRRGTE